MAETKEDDIVVFEDSQGNEISNDPRWHAQRVLGLTGVDPSELQSQIDELTAKLAEAEAKAAATSEPDEEDDTDTTSDDGDDYDKLDGKALKAQAKDRNVDISGLTKVGQVRDALRAADKAAE